MHRLIAMLVCLFAAACSLVDAHHANDDDALRPRTKELKAAIHAHRDDVFRCYATRRATDASLRGRVIVVWELAENGSTTVSLAATTSEVLARASHTFPTSTDTAGDRRLVDDPALRDCIARIDLGLAPAAIDQMKHANIAVPFLFGVAPREPVAVVLDASGIDVDVAQTETGFIDMLVEPCLQAGLTPDPDLFLDWTRHDRQDVVELLVEPPSEWATCVVKNASTVRPFPSLEEGRVGLDVRVLTH